jgi:hypothetical protein
LFAVVVIFSSWVALKFEFCLLLLHFSSLVTSRFFVFVCCFLIDLLLLCWLLSCLFLFAVVDRFSSLVAACFIISSCLFECLFPRITVLSVRKLCRSRKYSSSMLLLLCNKT